MVAFNADNVKRDPNEQEANAKHLQSSAKPSAESMADFQPVLELRRAVTSAQKQKQSMEKKLAMPALNEVKHQRI